MSRIELNRVSKRYGDIVAVNDVCAIIEDNEFFCFFGPPSSGKTTLLRLILGLETPDSGEVLIDGRNVNRVPAAQRNLSMVFQNLALFPHLTAEQNLSFPLIERRRPQYEIRSRLREIADKLHISHVLHKRPALLSGGERQRVAIGRALMREAQGYLMDDPISALDARLREEMRVELKRLQRDIGHTLVYVTHDQEEAMAIADRMAILDAGAVRQLDPPQAVYETPNCRYVAALVGVPSMNFVKGVLRNGSFCAEGLEWKHPAPLGSAADGERLEAGFRPEHMSVVEAGADSGMDGAVVSVEPLGASTVVVVACGSLTVKALFPGQPRHAVGEPIAILPRPGRVAFFHSATGERLSTV